MQLENMQLKKNMVIGQNSRKQSIANTRPETLLSWGLKVKVKSLSRIRLFATPWTIAHQAPPSLGFSRQEYWSGLPFPSPRSSTFNIAILMSFLCTLHLTPVFDGFPLKSFIVFILYLDLWFTLNWSLYRPRFILCVWLTIVLTSL